MSNSFRFSYFITPESAPISPEIRKYGEQRSMAAGAQLYNIGDTLTHLHYILEGELALSAISPDGNERICMIIRKNMFYGEAHLYKEFPTLFRVFATSPVSLLCFPLATARSLIDGSPEFRMSLLNGQAQKIVSMTGELVSLMSHTPEERVLNCLRDMAETVPLRDGEKEIRASQQEIARMLGMHRVTVNKALAVLKQRGSIRYGRGRVTLLNALLTATAGECTTQKK